MISYWNSFDRISVGDLFQSDLTNKVVIWGLTVGGSEYLISTLVGVLYHEVQARQTVRLARSSNTTISYLEFVETFLLLIRPTSRNIGGGLHFSQFFRG